MNMIMSVAAHFHHMLRLTLFDTVTILSVPLILAEVIGHPPRKNQEKKERQSIAALPWEEGD